MRRALIILLTCGVLLAGCLDTSTSGDDDGTDDDGEPGEVSQTVTFQESGSVTASVEAEGCGSTPEGINEHAWDIPTEVNGTATKVTAMDILLAFDGTVNDIDLFVYDPSGALVGESTAHNPVDGDDEQVSLNGNFDAGTWTLEVQGCNAVNAEYTLEASAELRGVVVVAAIEGGDDDVQ